LHGPWDKFGNWQKQDANGSGRHALTFLISENLIEQQNHPLTMTIGLKFAHSLWPIWKWTEEEEALSAFLRF
jgi:hypothetical protein